MLRIEESLGLNSETVQKLLKSFPERYVRKIFLDVYVERANGNIETDFTGSALSFTEQLLYKIFKLDVELHVAFEVNENDAHKIFDGNYSQFEFVRGYATYGAIQITKDFSNDTVEKIKISAKKCLLIIPKC